MGKGVPEKAKLRKRGPQLFFLISKRFQIGTHFKRLWWSITSCLLAMGLSSHLHPDLRSWVLHRGVDLCLKSSLVNRNLRVVKSEWAVLLPKGVQLFSSIIGHWSKAFCLAWRETVVRLAGLIQVLHHGSKEIPEQREWEAGLAHTAQTEETVQTGGFPTVVHFFLNLNSSLARELYALGTFQNSVQSLLVL